MRHLAYFLSNHGKQLRYKVMPFLNLFLVVVSVALNHRFNGGFCVFVVWAAVVQVLSFLNIILFTWLERTPLWRPNALMCGISTGVFLYWFCFTFPDNIILPIPQWFLFVLIWCNLVHPVNRKVRLWYAAGLAMCVVFVLWSGLPFRSAANGVRSGEYDKRDHDRRGRPDAAKALEPELGNGLGAVAQLAQQRRRHQVAGEHEEHDDTQMAAGQPGDVKVVAEHCKDGECAESVNRGHAPAVGTCLPAGVGSRATLGAARLPPSGLIDRPPAPLAAL